MRFQRPRPDVVDFSERDAKLKRDVEARRDRRRTEADAVKQRRLEESPYVYVPKVTREEAVVDSLSAAQRLHILRSPHITVDDLILPKPRLAPAAAAESTSTAASAVQSPFAMNVGARRKTARQLEDERNVEMSRNSQLVLERCFQPTFEVRTNNIDKAVAEGLRMQEEQREARLRYAGTKTAAPRAAPPAWDA